MDKLLEEARKYVGIESTDEVACDPVERGAVRRYSQAIMHDDIAFHDAECAGRFGGPVAPPLFPLHMFRRPFGTPDVLTERADDPDFDGVIATSAQGLPEIAPFRGLAVLNGGMEIEMRRYALHGEHVRLRSRYVDVTSRESRRGRIYLVVIETEYRTGEGDLLMTARRTQIRRNAS